MPLGTANVLVDRLWSPSAERNRAAVRAVALVIGFALLTAALAQFEVRLSFTPVPITGQTMGVLLAGGSLGWRLGAASQLMYWLFGLVSLPFYAGFTGGWKNGTGATMGYLVGFVVAAGVIGYLAERRQDRNLASSWSAMALGSIIIYAFGAGWLAHTLNIPVATGDTNALSLGVTPFLIGDLIKLLLAGSILPAMWAAVDRTK
ncbi:MAG: biotin transport system substrate-specific component [Ilumatobacteraceae bacterium]|jgi:biotin transport system substrate-specific component